jgi:transposase
MLRQVEIDQQTVSRAAKAFGFSRPSFYQAQSAFQDSGLAGLLPRKRGPRAGHKLTPELMQFVSELRFSEPGLSSPQLAERVRERFDVSIHPRSIDRQLRRQKKLR